MLKISEIEPRNFFSIFYWLNPRTAKLIWMYYYRNISLQTIIIQTWNISLLISMDVKWWFNDDLELVTIVEDVCGLSERNYHDIFYLLLHKRIQVHHDGVCFWLTIWKSYSSRIFPATSGPWSSWKQCCGFIFLNKSRIAQP